MRRTKFIQAHSSPLVCMALSLDGKLLATASERGTLVRIHSTADASKLQVGGRCTALLLAVQAQHPVALFQVVMLGRGLGEHIAQQGQASWHHRAHLTASKGLLCWVLLGGVLPTVSLAQQIPPSNPGRHQLSTYCPVGAGCAQMLLLSYWPWDGALMTDVFTAARLPACSPLLLFISSWVSIKAFLAAAGQHRRPLPPWCTRHHVCCTYCLRAAPTTICAAWRRYTHHHLCCTHCLRAAPTTTFAAPTTILAALQELRRGADPAQIFSIAFSRGESPDFVAVTSDKHTVHVFNLDRKQTQAIPALDQGDGQANGEQSPKNPISALSFVSVSTLESCMGCGKGQKRCSMA